MQEEGLSHMWQRHADMHKMLWEGLGEMGLKPYVEKAEERLVTVNTILVRHLLAPVLVAVLHRTARSCSHQGDRRAESVCLQQHLQLSRVRAAAGPACISNAACAGDSAQAASLT